MPVALSSSASTCLRKARPGRDGPLSHSVPSRFDNEARRSPPSCTVWRLPAAVQLPWNSIVSDADGGDGCGEHAATASVAPSTPSQHDACQGVSGFHPAPGSKLVIFAPRAVLSLPRSFS